MKTKIRGKKLTSAQRKLLIASDQNINAEEWLYVGQDTIDINGHKRSSKNDEKTIYMVFQNRITGEIKKCEIK